MMIAEHYTEEWRKEKNAKIRAKLFGYPDEPNVIIGEYMAIDHKRLLRRTETQTASTGSCESN